MLFELKIGGEIEQSEIDSGFSLRQYMEANSAREAVGKLMSTAPLGAKVLWARDEDLSVHMYDNNEMVRDSINNDYEYELELDETEAAYARSLSLWPNTIDVRHKEWTPDRTGCLIPTLSEVYDLIDDKYYALQENGQLDRSAEVESIVHWLIFGILHRRAKAASVKIYTQDISFDDIAHEVKADYLGWKHEKPCQKWLRDH